MKRCVLCLQELDLFAGLAVPQKERLCDSTDRLLLPRGRRLFAQGELTNSVYLIKSGRFKLVQSTSSGHETIVDICGPGEILGEMTILQQQEAPVSAVALEPSMVCCLSREQFEALVREDSMFAMRIIAYLGEKRYADMQKLGSETRQTVKEKLLHLFYKFAEESGSPHPDGTLITLRLTQQELADYVGASRVMVANAIKELEGMRALRREKRNYILLNDPCTSSHTFGETN